MHCNIIIGYAQALSYATNGMPHGLHSQLQSKQQYMYHLEYVHVEARIHPTDCTFVSVLQNYTRGEQYDAHELWRKIKCHEQVDKIKRVSTLQNMSSEEDPMLSDADEGAEGSDSEILKKKIQYIVRRLAYRSAGFTTYLRQLDRKAESLNNKQVRRQIMERIIGVDNDFKTVPEHPA